MEHRKKHLMELAKSRADSGDPRLIKDMLSERLTALDNLDQRLQNAEKDELRDRFQQFLLMTRECVEVYGRSASATASLKVDSDGSLDRIDVGIGTDDEPIYVGEYDVVVVIDQNPYISYVEIKEEVCQEIERQKKILKCLLREFDS